MGHETPLIATIAIGLALAFAFGLVAHRLKLPPIVGYLAAGVAVGPFTPGFVADQKLAVELAEIGVILLMFGVGLHFSLADLVSVRAIAIPSAIGQIAVATVLGLGLALSFGWSLGAGIVFGLALSVASTVVLLRALQERRQVETEKGRIAVGWLIVEDLVMVLTLVALPALAGALGGLTAATDNPGLVASLGIGPVWTTLVLTAIKVGAFVALMLIVGRRVVPWLLHYVAHTGSRELFRLAVFAMALGIAYGSASLFGVSFALGAFFAGMVLAESELSHRAATETLPLRDAFAVLFFVSVGMLFNPIVLVTQPVAVIATFLIIVLGKSIAAYVIVRAFGHGRDVALTISASLAQIGEFSFILIVLGVKLSITPPLAVDLIVAGAMLSIVVNPLIFLAIDRLGERSRSAPRPGSPASPDPVEAVVAEEVPATRLEGHVVLVGHGRVGSFIAGELAKQGAPLLVVDEDEDRLASLKAQGIEAMHGVSGEKAMLDRLNLAKARLLLTAIPDPFEAGHVIEAAREANPQLWIIARAHTVEGVEYLRLCGANEVVLGEMELALGMFERANVAWKASSPPEIKAGIPIQLP